MDELVKQAEAAGEAVKRKGAAKKALKDAKKKAHKEGAAPPPRRRRRRGAKAAAPKAAAPKAARRQRLAAASSTSAPTRRPRGHGDRRRRRRGATFAVDAALKKAQPYDGAWLVGTAATLADACCWAAVTTAAADAAAKSADVARWLKLCESQFAAALLKAAPKASGKAAEASADGGCPPLEGAVEGKVVTRFPPEPSGYLHIGHAKAVLLNDYYARRYKGKLLVRFDDTNPSRRRTSTRRTSSATSGARHRPEDKDSYVSLSHTSDHFDKIASLAEQLIDKGKAFMDDTPQQQMRDEREARSNSKHRDVEAKTNLQRFKDMREGKAPEWCLRAKIDMSSDNGTLRDPVMFRANDSPHHRAGTKYRAYPTSTSPAPSSTPSRASRTRPDPRVLAHQPSRALMSKRKLAWLVDQKAVEGWDDPRFPTIQGVVRRGVSVASLRDFIVSQGASRNIINLEWDSFWALNKAAYEAPSKRLMAGESMGMRPCRIGNTIYLEGDDAKTLAAGEEVVLMRWGLVKITKANGLALRRCVPGGVYKKKKTVLARGDARRRGADLGGVRLPHREAEARRGRRPRDAGRAHAVSMVETPAIGDPLCKFLMQGDVVQLERRGFFKCDVAHNPFAKEPAPIRLIYVPDGKPQHKVPFSRLPSAKKP
ncbi:hypothetical protein JL722_10521 [Aureococcus anophagefferens]|nr:hypothetical protein JL722_10521 [Aureococcus anophagefferens]